MGLASAIISSKILGFIFGFKVIDNKFEYDGHLYITDTTFFVNLELPYKRNEENGISLGKENEFQQNSFRMPRSICCESALETDYYYETARNILSKIWSENSFSVSSTRREEKKPVPLDNRFLNKIILLEIINILKSRKKFL